MKEETLKKLKRKVGPDLLAIPGVTGVGICDSIKGPALAVYFSELDAAAERKIRALVQGVPVSFIESGTFVNA